MLTTQPADSHAPETAPRVRRTIDGIADALTGARRMEFSRVVGQVEPSPAVADALSLPADQFVKIVTRNDHGFSCRR